MGRVRVGGDQRRAVCPRRTERRLQARSDLDEASQPNGDRVAGTARIGVVAGQLQSRHDEQTKKRACAGRLGVDLGEVAREHLRADVAVGCGVVGDREHIETGLTVEVTQFPRGELTVAPGGMRVQLAQKRR